PHLAQAGPAPADREAGPDPAGALAPGEPGNGDGPAGGAEGPEWGLDSSPEPGEVDLEALPDAPLPALDAAFPVPGQLRTRVDFWKFIYAGVGMYELVVHDTGHMDKIYEIVAMPARPVDWRSYLRVRRATLERARAKYRTILARLATATPRTALTAEERRVQALLADLPGGPEKYRAAARRLHAQAGMRDRFLQALAASEAYLPEMERIFRERNLPVELARLPFVESGFNPRAASKARAVGVWQFIRSTARRYDLVTKKADLRRDVTASTIAAARLLAFNYRETGSWPLALMAYHHGLGGIKRAVRVTGTTDVDVIVRTYRGPRFRYASRNYYAQFVAVNELYEQIRDGEARGLAPEEVLAAIPRPAALGPEPAAEAGAAGPSGRP
ncbi:MAG TPA: lytic transglycosylase domain-containing protein, partial [Thermodesulfobacteriota bacterium]|nr:lytic transglycosylase domain-containing protein [Thermodesulfobacteriota bacterium]